MKNTQLAGLQTKRQNLIDHISETIPGFELRSKQESLTFKILAKVMFWNPGILDRFITTLYPKVYVPQLPYHPDDPARAIGILSHEYVHLQDRKRLGWLFNFLYLSPQILSLFSLMSIYSPWFLFSLIFLAPIPSPGRAWLEYRGYRTSMAVHYWITGEDYGVEWITSQFTGSNYYWMFPFPTFLLSRLKKDYEKITQNDLNSELKELKSILEL